MAMLFQMLTVLFLVGGFVLRYEFRIVALTSYLVAVRVYIVEV